MLYPACRITDVMIIARFETMFTKSDSGCWEWFPLRCSKHGYGLFSLPGKYSETGKNRDESAHRVSYRIYKGEIPDLYEDYHGYMMGWNTTPPERMIVRHRCDNPPCVNPDHLILGNHFDNTQDALNRGRLRRKSIT